MAKVKNYARFYALLNNVQTGDKQDFKEEMVAQFTKGRTSSLREMTNTEYNLMCDSIDPKVNKVLRERTEIKADRSAVLKRLQKLGVDTTDWNKVDAFCLNKRIAGKKFYELSCDELKGMIPKLIAIAKKDKEKEIKVQPRQDVISDKAVAYLLNTMPKNQLLN